MVVGSPASGGQMTARYSTAARPSGPTIGSPKVNVARDSSSNERVA
jgi:hypothetical protein